jgi:hypothetical protein
VQACRDLRRESMSLGVEDRAEAAFLQRELELGQGSREIRTVCGLAAHARPHTRSLRESQAIRPRDTSQVELGSSRAEPRDSEAINAMLPGENLVGIERVAATSLFQGQQAAAHGRDDFRLAPDYPAFGVGWWQIAEGQTTSLGSTDMLDRRLRSFIHRGQRELIALSQGPVPHYVINRRTLRRHLPVPPASIADTIYCPKLELK